MLVTVEEGPDEDLESAAEGGDGTRDGGASEGPL